MAIALQTAHRLADGRTAGVELLGQALLNEADSRRALAAQELAPECLVDPLGMRLGGAATTG